MKARKTRKDRKIVKNSPAPVPSNKVVDIPAPVKVVENIPVVPKIEISKVVSKTDSFVD